MDLLLLLLLLSQVLLVFSAIQLIYQCSSNARVALRRFELWRVLLFTASHKKYR